MTTKFGDFLPPQFNAIGDKFSDHEKPGDRDRGLAFKAPVSKIGKNNDACFDKAKILFEGEKYVDSSRQKLLANAEKKKGMVSELPFKLCSPMKKSTGPGDFQGTLQGKVEYIAGSPETKAKKGDFVGEKPNLYTSPGKKGTYGYNKTTLSEKRAPGGMHGEYSYAVDPYNRAHTLAVEEKKRAKNVSELPFRPANPPKRGTYGYAKTNIGNKAMGANGEYTYEAQGATSASSKAGSVHKPKGAPFVPSRMPRKGYNCTLNKFPEHYADPDQLKADARRLASKLERQALGSRSPWHPSNVPRVAATRSIVRMNV